MSNLDIFAKNGVRHDPFPHLVIKGFWGRMARSVAAEWPAEDDPRWRRYRDNKRGMMDRAAMGPVTRNMLCLGMFNNFRDVLRKYVVPDVAANDLFCDGSLFGAGLHESGHGAKLGMHVDFNTMERNGQTLYRRANVLLYLNEMWLPGYGGILYLGKDRTASVIPEMDTMVMMPCTEDSWHGHPDPVCGPFSRRSMAWYWYSTTPPDGFRNSHSTIYEVRD